MTTRSHPRRGTPPAFTEKGAQTRRRIVECAAELIFARGIAGTTVADVQEAAGVSTSQIYHYFANKRALVRAVIEYLTDHIVGSQEPVLARLDSLEALRTWRDTVVAHAREVNCRGGCPIGSIGSELAELDDDARADVAASFARWSAAIQDGLRTMHAHEMLRSDIDPDELALAMLSALQGGLLLSQVQRTTAPLEAALDAMLLLVSQLRP